MTLTLIVFLALRLLSFGDESCSLSEKEIKISLEQLFKEGIIETSKDTLWLKISNINYCNDSLKRIYNKDKLVIIQDSNISNPATIIFNSYPSTKYNNRILLKFRIKGEGGYKYEGEMTFDCIDDKLVYKDCHYLSEIE